MQKVQSKIQVQTNFYVPCACKRINPIIFAAISETYLRNYLKVCLDTLRRESRKVVSWDCYQAESFKKPKIPVQVCNKETSG